MSATTPEPVTTEITEQAIDVDPPADEAVPETEDEQPGPPEDVAAQDDEGTDDGCE